MKTSTKGYTLVELLIVGTILSILAVVSYKFFNGNFFKNNKIKEARSQMMSLRLALKSYLADTDEWPVLDGFALGIAPHDNTQWENALINGNSETGWHGPYALAVPNDPWEHRYIYMNYNVSPDSFSAIVCQGPLGTDNGTAPHYAIADPYAIANKVTYPPDRHGFSIVPSVEAEDFSIILWME
ncbi:MAG: type II secretion system protein GspG [bacterium]|nr:type II secretion system protein GspG [bacterium]MDD5354027.1 type II secretion system protein GspG [bacterium]MDD5755982.1 type II secretion system protein GspG [bacterium]